MYANLGKRQTTKYRFDFKDSSLLIGCLGLTNLRIFDIISLSTNTGDETMKYTDEFNVDSFQFWSGALDTVNEIRKAGKMDNLQILIEDHFALSVPTKTEINDFVWFNRSEILESLEIEDVE